MKRIFSLLLVALALASCAQENFGITEIDNPRADKKITIYGETVAVNFIADGETIVTRGPLKSGEYNLPGNVSSQFISGLLFALPTLKGDSTIKITSAVESRSYINLTMKAISEFGIKTEWQDDYTILIPGGQIYKPCDIRVEGDFSGAAFPDAFNFLGGEVEIEGLSDTSAQGDRIYKKHFEKIFHN